MTNINNIIRKTYVINLKKRTDRWIDINNNFDQIPLKLIRWDAVYGKDLSDNEIKELTTKTCYYCCSPSMVGIWQSHYKLWQHIVKNKESAVLILEDDSSPINKETFEKDFIEYWKGIPNDWDMVFLGGFGTCDKSNFEKYFFYAYSGNTNKSVYKNGKLQTNVIKPGFPLGLHAYMLSFKGAKKLLDSKYFDKVSYHIDHQIAKKMVPDDNFNVYAFQKNLINQNLDSQYSDNQATHHPLFSYFGSKIKFTEQHTLDSAGAIQILYFRKVGFSLTIFNSIFFIISFLIGFSVNTNTNFIQKYLWWISIYYCIEIIYGKNEHIKELIMELIFIFLMTFAGIKLKNILNRKYKFKKWLSNKIRY